MKTAIIVGAALGILSICAQRKLYKLANNSMKTLLNS